MRQEKEIKGEQQQDTTALSRVNLMVLVLVIVAIFWVFFYFSEKAEKVAQSEEPVSNKTVPSVALTKELDQANLPIIAQKVDAVLLGAKPFQVEIGTEFGELQVEFYPEYAPATVAKLFKLIKSGYFNGDLFMEARPNLGFVIAKLGDSVKTFKFEDDKNNVISRRGSIAISKSSVSNAYLNNIFFGYNARPDLEQHYIFIGQVIKGLEIVEESVGNLRYKINHFRLKDTGNSTLTIRNAVDSEIKMMK